MAPYVEDRATEADGESLAYLAFGAGGAILLGMALVPLRGLTIASNFTFPFLALVIVVAEFGGRRAAVATALTSALSLDFFLTEPYLRLTIAGKHDVIAFLGLAGCGLVAAAIGSSRATRAASSRAERDRLELLHEALAATQEGGPIEPTISAMLRSALRCFPLSAAAVRGEDGAALAATSVASSLPVPSHLLQSDTLLIPSSSAAGVPGRGLPLPRDGGRLPLVAGNRQVGWLDLWGNGLSANRQTRRTLSDVGRVIGLLVARASSPKESFPS